MDFIPRKLRILVNVFIRVYSIERLTSFSVVDHHPFFLCTVFNAILCNIDEVISINLSTNVFVIGDLNAHNKDWITYSSETDRSFELSCNFSISKYRIEMANFPSWICHCGSHSPAFLHLLVFTDPSICSTLSFPLTDPSMCSTVSFPLTVSIDFSQTQLVILFCTTQIFIIIKLIGIVFEII